jgi:hypothetical protein
VQGRDGGLGLELAEPVAAQRGLQERDALGDERGVPAGAVLLGQRDQAAVAPGPGRISASSPAVSSSSVIDASSRVSRIASAARSMSPV